MAFHHSPRIITDGLVLSLDAADKNSYPGSGTTWSDLSGNGYDFTLTNANLWTANADGTHYMDFTNGGSKYIPGGTLTNVPAYAEATICIWSAIKAPDSQWKTLVRGATSDHQVIIFTTDGVSLGMYDNNSAGFIDTGWDVNTMSNYQTQFHFMVWKLSTSSPYYQFYYDGNLSSSTASLTNSNATFNNGFASVGAYHNANSTPTSYGQPWGKIGSFAYYSRHLTEAELKQNFNAHRHRFGV
jgi:hypothetical protein